MKAAAIAALVLIVPAAAQQTAPGPGHGTVLAMDHLESKGVTVWIVASAGGERSLLVARLGAPIATRLRGRLLRDVILEASAKTALVLVGQDQPFALEQLALDGEAEPRVVVADLSMADPMLGRSGDDVLVLTSDSVVAVGGDGEPRPLYRREDAAITAVAMNGRRTVLATTRGGEIELSKPDGEALGNLGQGHDPTFVEDGDLAFVRRWEGARDRRRSSEVVLADVAELEVPGRPILDLAGEITGLRFAGDASLLFRHVSTLGESRYWLLHVATGIVRPMDPDDFGGLRAATSQPASRPRTVIDPAAAAALPEPETTASGFFAVDEFGRESRTYYEETGFDDAKSPDEARVHASLLTRFLEGVQWPFRREGAYEPLIAADDEPLRAYSAVPHRGLDLGSRLVHASTGSVAFHAPGTYVFPLYRGGYVWFGRAAVPRDGGSSGEVFAGRRYPILQEVELREGNYVLRIHVAYEHARPVGLGEPTGAAPEAAFQVTGDQPVGDLEAFSDAGPSGGWITSDPRLHAARIAKGNHVHVGIGGIYRSFNGSAESAARKLRWYQDRLVPAVKRSRGPK